MHQVDYGALGKEKILQGLVDGGSIVWLSGIPEAKNCSLCNNNALALTPRQVIQKQS